MLRAARNNDRGGKVCLHSEPVTSMVLAADGRHFFTAAADGSVFMCSLQVRPEHAHRHADRSRLGSRRPEEGGRGFIYIYIISFHLVFC